jgi:hypothetical protein
MVGGTLDEDEPAFSASWPTSSISMATPYRAVYPGAKALIGRAAEPDAEHEAAFIQLVADQDHGQAEPARVFAVRPADRGAGTPRLPALQEPSR